MNKFYLLDYRKYLGIGRPKKSDYIIFTNLKELANLFTNGLITNLKIIKVKDYKST